MTVIPSRPGDGALTVDVWVRRVVDVPDGRELLDDHERAALNRIVRPQSARGYAAAHALARRAVAQVVGSSAAQVRFDRTCDGCGEQHGRPTLPDYRTLHVSLSHTEVLVAVAMTTSLPVGVDVESADATAFDGFPQVALHPDERDEAEGCAAARSQRRALTWVRKEAALKALGTGLRREPADLLTPPSGIPVDLLGDGRWVTLQDVPLPWDDAAAAVALAGQSGDLVVRVR